MFPVCIRDWSQGHSEYIWAFSRNNNYIMLDSFPEKLFQRMPCPSFVSLLMNLSTQKLNRHSRAGSKASLSHQYQEPVASQRANFPLKCLTQNTMLFYKACTWSSWSSSSVQCGIQACSIITEAVELHELCPTLTQVLLEPHRWPSSNPPYLLPALS